MNNLFHFIVLHFVPVHHAAMQWRHALGASFPINGFHYSGAVFLSHIVPLLHNNGIGLFCMKGVQALR